MRRLRLSIRIAGLAAVFVALPVACAGAPPSGEIQDRLLAADRAFLQATLDDGLEGWLSSFTADAMRIDPRGETAIGLDEIRAFDAPLFEDGGLRLIWEPRTAAGFAGGREGVTQGRYTLVRPAQDGGDPEVVGSGGYLTLWRLEDGHFRVYLDTGFPDPPARALLHERSR